MTNTKATKGHESNLIQAKMHHQCSTFLFWPACHSLEQFTIYTVNFSSLSAFTCTIRNVDCSTFIIAIASFVDAFVTAILYYFCVLYG